LVKKKFEVLLFFYPEISLTNITTNKDSLRYFCVLFLTQRRKGFYAKGAMSVEKSNIRNK